MIKDINNIQILVITDDEDIKNQANELNVNFVLNSQTAIKKIKAGWNDFDIVIITPEMMGKVGCLGKYLGPQGKMPCPKCDTVVSKNPEKELFNLNEMVLKKDIGGCLDSYKILISSNVDETIIIDGLAKQYRLLYQTKLMNSNNEYEISKELKVKPFVIKIHL